MHVKKFTVDCLGKVVAVPNWIQKGLTKQTNKQTLCQVHVCPLLPFVAYKEIHCRFLGALREVVSVTSKTTFGGRTKLSIQ